MTLEQVCNMALGGKDSYSLSKEWSFLLEEYYYPGNLCTDNNFLCKIIKINLYISWEALLSWICVRLTSLWIWFNSTHNKCIWKKASCCAMFCILVWPQRIFPIISLRWTHFEPFRSCIWHPGPFSLHMFHNNRTVEIWL